MRNINTQIKSVLGKIIPDQLKELLFRKAFAIMSDSQRVVQMSWLEDCPFQPAAMSWSLRNLKSLGFSPKIIIDVGAHQGMWTKLAMKIFPDAYIFMVEAQSDKEEYLKDIQKNAPQSIGYTISLLGAQSNEAVSFYVTQGSSGASVLEEQSNSPRQVVTLSMTYLDRVVADHHLEEVSFLKLDVQGYELEVLKGAMQTLKNIEVIVMEVSLLQYNKNAPLFDEVVVFMKTQGFVMYDICGLMRRPQDNALFQMDALFVREDSNLLKDKFTIYKRYITE
jgi:FkbM family methyltransferase